MTIAKTAVFFTFTLNDFASRTHHVVYGFARILVSQVDWIHVESAMQSSAVFYPET